MILYFFILISHYLTSMRTDDDETYKTLFTLLVVKCEIYKILEL